MIRYSLSILGFSVLLIYGTGCAISSHNVIKEDKTDSEIRIYEVFGMNCPGCTGGLIKLAKKIQAVQQAEANWEKKRLMIKVLPGAQLNDEDIFDAIQRANFTAGKRIK